MNRPTTLLALALLAAAATASAHPLLETKTPIALVSTASLGFGFGAAFCEEASPGLPTHCGTGGVGIAIFDTTDFNAHGATQVDGTCLAQKPVTSLGDLGFLCANDRDDDSFITSTDFNGDDDSAGSDHGTNANGYDDQFYAGSVPSGTASASIPVCFTHDADSAAAGHDWDEVFVFVQGNLPVPYAGLTAVTLSLNDRSANC